MSARRCNNHTMGTDELRMAQASSFGAAAAAYERGRPSYPEHALDWLLPPGARRVADVGAGTGKLTRLLRGRGLDVVAVEPSPGMRAQFTRSVPGVPALCGTAEEIPVADGSLDAVMLAQAWHWADPARALPEIARALAPGGRLCLLWNVRDERVGWVAELGRIMHTADQLEADHTPPLGRPFRPPERLVVRWVSHLTPGMVIDLVSSRSYVLTRPPAERAAILGSVRHLLDTHPALAGMDDIALPYLTMCTRAQLS